MSGTTRIDLDVGGADPLVRAYILANRGTCAAHVMHWWWIALGLAAALAGGVIGSLLAGPPEALSGAEGETVRSLHALIGNPWAALTGMLVGGALTALAGAWIKPHGVPASQEPWLGTAVAVLVYLLLFDALACLGVITGLICLIYAAAISFRLLALGLGGKLPPRAEIPADLPDDSWPMYTVLVPLYREPEVASSILASPTTRASVST